MKKLASLLAALVLLPATAIANDRTEEGTAASRNVAERNLSSGNAGATNTMGFGIPYVNPAGSEPSKGLVNRYGVGAIATVEFLTIKRHGINFDSGKER